MTLSISWRSAMTGQLMAVAAALPSYVLAQTQPDTPAPDTNLNAVVVTGTRSAQYIRDVLSDNVLISAEEIAKSGQTSLVELLQRQRGIEINRNGGPGATASVFIRGANNNQSVVLVDGVRIGSSTVGGATWSTIPLEQIDHVEIVYGPLSSLYGADAIGGVVQIFTKKGSGPLRVNASAGYGRYATEELSAGLSGATDSERRLHYAISAAHEKSDGFTATKPGNFSYNPDKDGYRKDSASGQFSVDIAKGHELGLQFLQSRLNAQYDSGASSYDSRTLQKLESYALYANDQILADWTSHLQVSQARDKAGSDQSALASGQSQIDTTQKDISWQHDLRIGSDMLQVLLERRKELVYTSTTPAVNGERSTDSVAASYQLKRGAHLASASVRNDDSSQYGGHVTGSVGYGYRLTDALRANAGFSTSFRAPTFNELYYPNFGIASNKPEQGRNAEAGLYYEDGTSQASVVYYRNRIRDLLVTATVCPVELASHPFGCSYNVDKALLTGLSLGASTRLQRYTLRGSLDLQDPREETTDKLLTRRARTHASFGLDYELGALQTGAEWILSGKRYDDAANKNVLPGYGLLNLYAAYDVARNWSVFGRWNNVTDKEYELAKYYATTRSNLFVGIRYAMK